MSSSQMIDWDLAVSTGERLARPGPQIPMSEARQAVLELRELSVEARRHVHEFTQMNGSHTPDAAAVVDRPGWIKSNVAGFRVVFEPLLQKMAQRRPALSDRSLVTAIGSRMTGVQMGAILAYLAGRVLGQYELFLPPDPSGAAPTGRLTLVAPNIVMVERELDVDPHDFRLWVCLHEETHRTQFTAVPWLRSYVQDQMAEFLLASDLGPAEVLDRLRQAAEVVADAVRGGESSIIDVIQSPDQRAVLDRLTAVMTLVEGHGDYVMDAVGPEVVPSVSVIRSRFTARREGGGRVDKTIRRLLGIDLKMRQYAEGSTFVRTVIDEVGISGFNKIWTSPQTLPSGEEITRPEVWIDRVVRGDSTSRPRAVEG